MSDLFDPMRSLISILAPDTADDEPLVGYKRKSIPLSIAQMAYVDELVNRSRGNMSATTVVRQFIDLGIQSFLSELSSVSDGLFNDYSESVKARILSQITSDSGGYAGGNDELDKDEDNVDS
jgi:hypothetical protein